MTYLITTKAPNLPTAPAVYDPHAQDIFNSVLRLYFNTIDNFIQNQVVATVNGTVFANVTTAQKNAIVAPKAGQVVFDTTLAKLCVYSGAAWQTITSV
jgi:hypothetical protein